jgi:hypothetical protein
MCMSALSVFPFPALNSGINFVLSYVSHMLSLKTFRLIQRLVLSCVHFTTSNKVDPNCT